MQLKAQLADYFFTKKKQWDLNLKQEGFAISLSVWIILIYSTVKIQKKTK